MLKRTISLIICLISILLVSGCKSKELNTYTVKVDNGGFEIANPILYSEVPNDKLKEKYSIEDFAIIWNQLHQSNKQPQDFFDITTESIWNDLNGQLFRDDITFLTYLIYQGKVFEIGAGESFGSLGVVSIETCDFDLNGQKDLIYSYSIGYGRHVQIIGIINLVEMLNYSFAFNMFDDDRVLEKLADDNFNVYISELEYDDKYRAHFIIKSKKLAAIIKQDQGKVVVIEYINK